MVEDRESATTPGMTPVAAPATAVQPPAATSTPETDPTQASAENQPAGLDTPETPQDPGFLERGGLRRRLRFLRKTRELAYRDLGGLVFEMHRLGQERKDLLDGKLATLGRIDREVRGIESALQTNRGVTVLREAGVTACPRCAAIHGSEDRFCPACGFSMSSAERPIAANPVAAPVATTAQAPATTPPPTSARPHPSPSPSPLSATLPAPPAAPPVTSRTPPAPASRNGPAQPPRQPAEVDEPTEIVEAPTQIVRPGDPPQAGKSSRA
jgi:hypothetical protein